MQVLHDERRCPADQQLVELLRMRHCNLQHRLDTRPSHTNKAGVRGSSTEDTTRRTLGFASTEGNGAE